MIYLLGGMGSYRGGKRGSGKRGQGRRSWSNEEREATKRQLLDRLPPLRSWLI